MKKNKIFSSIIMLTILCSFLGAFAPQSVVGSAGASFWLTGGEVTITGDRPTGSGAGNIRMDIVAPLSVTIPNATQVIILDNHAWNADVELAPNDLATTGITRAYSSSYAACVSRIEGAAGIFSTLRILNEDNFTEHTTDKDVDVLTLYSLEPIYTTVNTAMTAYGLTVANFTPYTVKVQLSFDKSLVDTFFTNVAGDANFADIAENHFTDTALIANLIEDYFAVTMLDLVYGNINMTDYATAWTIGAEVESVLGGNATDVSVDYALELGSIRNAAIGFIGLHLADLSSAGIPQSVMPELPSEDYFSAFAQTDDEYLLDFSIISDFVSSNALIAGLGVLLSQMFPHVATASGGVAFPLYVHLIVIGVVGLIAGVIAYFVSGKDKKAFWKAFGIAAAVTALVMFLGFPVSSIF